MRLHTLGLGRDASKKIWLGSLDLLEAPETHSFLPATEEQIGAASGEVVMIQRPIVDLVISKPPIYTSGKRRREGGRHCSRVLAAGG